MCVVIPPVGSLREWFFFSTFFVCLIYILFFSVAKQNSGGSSSTGFFFILHVFFSFRRLFIYCYRFVLISSRARPNNNAVRARPLFTKREPRPTATVPACYSGALMKRNNVRVSWMPKTNVVSSVDWKSDYHNPSTPPQSPPPHDGSFRNLLQRYFFLPFIFSAAVCEINHFFLVICIYYTIIFRLQRTTRIYKFHGGSSLSLPRNSYSFRCLHVIQITRFFVPLYSSLMSLVRYKK